MYMYSPVAIVRVHIRSVSTDVAVDIHLLISAKPKLQYYAGAVSQVSHVPGQMTLEMHQDARRCVKLWGPITFSDRKPPTNGPGTARCCLLESAASHTNTVESIPRRERTRSVSLA